MTLGDRISHYDVLEVSPDATPQEIREAYLRLKSAYAKDSLALYTLMNGEDTEKMRQQIEDAYLVLSNIERRRDYDRDHGLLSLEDEMIHAPRDRTPAKVISIGRPQPEEIPDEDLLIAPSTDFTVSREETVIRSREYQSKTPSSASETASSERKQTASLNSASPSGTTGPDPLLLNRIRSESEWPGGLIQEVREAYAISLEEMAGFTKISKNYLRAIESEDFDKLPAAVYLRGFLMQISKKLKLPSDKVAGAYVGRFRQKCPDKA